MAVILTVRPWVFLPTIVLGVVFVILRCFYMASARDIKRLDGISKSPIFSHLSNSMHGVTTIRAFSAEPLLQAQFDRMQDLHTSGSFALISGTSWFAVYMDWIVVVFLACVVFSFPLLSGDFVGGDVGLAISSCIMLTGLLQHGVLQSAHVENLMTTVERVMEYSKLDPESLHPHTDCKVPFQKYWSTFAQKRPRRKRATTAKQLKLCPRDPRQSIKHALGILN